MMLRPPVTVSVVFVNGMLSGWEARGRSCESILLEAGIAPELRHQPGARVSAEQYVLLFKLLIERFDDECLGFMSRRLKPGSLALITLRAISGRTLEVAIRRVAHVFSLMHDDVELEVLHEGDLCGLALSFTDPAAQHPPFLHELLLRVFWRLLAWLVGGVLPVARFDFAFPPPPYMSSYEKVFPAPLHFNCQQSAFWFDAQLLERPVRRDETSMRKFLAEAQAQVVLPRRRDDLFSAKVRGHLQHAQPAWPDLGETAEALHLSPSTLQRRLAREGITFQSLKDELRRDAAITRLANSKVSFTSLAAELGFADSAAFQRAFKAWTGSAPGAYRSEL